MQQWWIEASSFDLRAKTFEQVAHEIQLITEAVDAKLDLWRARMAEKDQVIKRLYVKVKQLSESAKTPAQSSTRSPLRRR